MASLKDRAAAFIEERTSAKSALERAFDLEAEGGPSFVHVFGTALAVLFIVELVTGSLLSLTYVPSIDDAWSSVFYIEHRVTAGAFLRGLHARCGEAIVIVLALHLAQVMLLGAYRRPREVTYWIGLAMLGVFAGALLTGARLPWDQKSYWALAVELNIAASIPVIGQTLYELAAGGTAIGQATLSRIHALHTVILPGAACGLLAIKLALVRKHGLSSMRGPEPLEKLAPRQPAYDLAFSALLVIGIVAVVRAFPTPLGSPADPSRDFPARPEWFLLFLYELRKIFESSSELIGTVVLPGVATTYLVALPLLDRGPTNLKRRMALFAPVVIGGIAMASLTGYSIRRDGGDAEHRAALEEADRIAARSIVLASSGIPPEGPLEMQRRDPMLRGRELYAQYCTSCHMLDGPWPPGTEPERHAPDHDGFGSRAWVVELLKAPESERFFRHAELDEEMPSQTTRLGGEPGLRAVAEFLFSEGVEGEELFDRSLAERGRTLFEQRCKGCHVYRGDGDFNGIGGPNLTMWGSRTWLVRQIAHPESTTQYGELNGMPAFGEDLSEHDVKMIAAFLRRQRFDEDAFRRAAR